MHANSSLFRVIVTNVTRGFTLCAQGSRHRGRDAAVDASSRNVTAEQRAKFGADRKRSASAGTSSRETQSSKGENSVKRRAVRSQGPRWREWLLSSRKESKDAKTPEPAPAHKGRLFADEASDVAIAGNDDPIDTLRKEIRDWRACGQLSEFEREHLITDSGGTKKNVLRGKV